MSKRETILRPNRYISTGASYMDRLAQSGLTYVRRPVSSRQKLYIAGLENYLKENGIKYKTFEERTEGHNWFKDNLCAKQHISYLHYLIVSNGLRFEEVKIPILDRKEKEPTPYSAKPIKGFKKLSVK